ncbi:hypothetical protein [Hazenella coriacea]|uniref:Uncharacterized protein n=1 Tax=Hazenella coriacea TaxID=1179467 RepID=A0A4R3L1G0_9BACL|nr:hypothetical protein [Hazenella coriacea]TCS92805.1 hypothetical protein EDD58_11031 [Hazenella coriacea]
MGVRKSWFHWLFRGSACLHFTSSLFMLFVLMHVVGGSFGVRMNYFLYNEHWVIVSWLSSLLAIFSMVATFSIFTFALDQSYRIILRWAWLISVIGAVAILLNHFMQVTIIANLFKLFWQMPSYDLANHMQQWDDLLSLIMKLYAPTCFAISGLIYTAVMFRTHFFSKVLNWWSLSIWGVLLGGTVVFNYIQEWFPYFIGSSIFMYIPWLWIVGGKMKPQFSN